mmetsp:Transcript_20949/g.43917  ORF Transcript_20949/g.43917 Transcript_20949/m.43917 type:complete len:293 (-) Transcript_20949:98-976(-)
MPRCLRLSVAFRVTIRIRRILAVKTRSFVCSTGVGNIVVASDVVGMILCDPSRPSLAPVVIVFELINIVDFLNFTIRMLRGGAPGIFVNEVSSGNVEHGAPHAIRAPSHYFVPSCQAMLMIVVFVIIITTRVLSLLTKLIIIGIDQIDAYLFLLLLRGRWKGLFQVVFLHKSSSTRSFFGWGRFSPRSFSSIRIVAAVKGRLEEFPVGLVGKSSCCLLLRRATNLVARHRFLLFRLSVSAKSILGSFCNCHSLTHRNPVTVMVTDAVVVNCIPIAFFFCMIATKFFLFFRVR